MTLDGKVAVVTGGGSGIGEAICIRLAADGARVAVLDVDIDAAGLTATLVGGIAVEADVSDSASVDRALAAAESGLGPVDVWVNNAGIAAAAQAARIRPAGGGTVRRGCGDRKDRDGARRPRPATGR